MEAYCVKCKAKREITDGKADFNRIGSPITHGICGVCGTRIFRTGRTPAHEGLIKPEKEVKKEGKLVIVESPAKARTISRYLGKGYTVKASVGHVRDLLRSRLSVDVDNNYQPDYRVPNEKRPIVKELKELAKNAEEIYLATDPDREGEAIAWHLVEAAEINLKVSHRVVFHEITQNAITEAFSAPRDIDMDLVNAQQARRVLDRLVGYGISPILWEKVRSRLSAGRVQSVALKLIVQRENEIDEFKSQEYWTILAELMPVNGSTSYIARLSRIDDKEPILSEESEVNSFLSDLESSNYQIVKIKKSERRRKPSSPFITSTLQQEASRQLGFTAKRTMALAQQLYEGLDVNERGSTGLISYMRTDSTNIADSAVAETREYIKKVFGNKFLPDIPPQYKTRAAVAQEAHECIRPTSTMRTPESIKGHLNREQFRLYQLIWQRFVACQMEPAVYDTQSIEINGEGENHQYLFRISGSTIKFQGFLVLYEDAKDEDQKPDGEDSDNSPIPPGLFEGQKQKLIRIIPEQHFTQPPPRYTEASLVQVLEEHGIGRPSTYAVILSNIVDRNYVIKEAKRFTPTETGVLVNGLIVEHFPEIVNLGFTANMEQDLDKVANGKDSWTEVVDNFYKRFGQQLKKAQVDIPVTKTELEKVGRICPRCGQDLVIRWGRYGKFISCSGFPECRYTEALLEKIGVLCPDDGGEIVQRKTRKGRIFFGCNNYPGCSFTSWKRPIKSKCSKCGGLLVIANKREVQCIVCQENILIEQIEEKSEEAA